MENRPNSGGNRPETRARGNAPQLHEKYKAMARDAQLAGDRVQTEYYLQFADHYYRILNENRPRFDEQRPRNGDASGDDYEEDDGDVSEDGGDGGGQYEGDDTPTRQQPRAQERSQREDRPQPGDRPQRDDRPQREAQGYSRDGQARDGQGRDNQSRDGQARNGQARDGSGRDAQAREAQGQNRDNQPRDNQSREDRQSRDDKPRSRTARGDDDRMQHFTQASAHQPNDAQPPVQSQDQDRSQPSYTPNEDDNGQRPPRATQSRDTSEPSARPGVADPAAEAKADRPRRASRVLAEGAVRTPRGRPRERSADSPGIDLDRLPPAIARSIPETVMSQDTAGGDDRAVNDDVPNDVAANVVDSQDGDRPRPARRPRRPREDTPAEA